MSPTPTTSRRPQSSPTRSSWTRRRSSPTKSLLRTPTTMTLHSRVCFAKLTEYMAITLHEKTCLSVCRRRQCPTERGDPLETERSDPLSKETRKQILAECQARISQHEFQAARAEEEQRHLQGQLLQQKLEFREAHQRSLTEMEE